VEKHFLLLLLREQKYLSKNMSIREKYENAEENMNAAEMQ
jgi:hypothetical protein